MNFFIFFKKKYYKSLKDHNFFLNAVNLSQYSVYSVKIIEYYKGIIIKIFQPRPF